tara:strand:+ start:758 stop:1009 length:252 start_codon:yes stop_codon:yes gene_type:complete
MNTNTANKEVFDKWLTWRSRSVKLPQLYTKSGNTSIRLSKPTSEIRDLCNAIGLREDIDYIFRNQELRFATNEQLAFFKINYR